MRKVSSDSPPSPIFTPDFSFETELQRQGFSSICGVDEAGRGPLAGPVTAAAVILDPDNVPVGLHDSKKLNERKREVLFEAILKSANVSIASISARTIDRINIRAASLLAMQQAVTGLAIPADYALIDGNALPRNMPCPADYLIKGDARCLSISAASIVAKVTRDRLMVHADIYYPGYGLAGHKGYPTASHREAVIRFGPCGLHRKTFAPVAAALGNRAKKNPAS